MIETTVLNYLTGALTNIPVYMEIPENPPASFVVLEKTGTSRSNRVTSATIAAQSYAASMVGAATLNETVKAAFDNMAELNEIGAVKLNSDYNFTNTATKKYRYQAVFVVTFAD